MDHIFITDNLEKPSAPDLVHRIAQGLMTPDMRAAIAAGCTFEVTFRKTADAIVFKMRTHQKVSILKTPEPEGRPISVLVKR